MRSIIPKKSFLLTGVILAAFNTFVPPAFATVNPVSNLSASKVFSPNGDGVKDVAVIKFEMTKKATLSFTIESGKKIVRTLFSHSSMTEGLKTIYWNGRDNTGGRLTDGYYRAVTTVAIDGESFKKAVSIKLDTMGPSTTTASLNPNPFWPNGDRFKDYTKFTARFNELSTFGFRVTDSSGKSLFSKSFPALSTAFSQVWTGVSGQQAVSYGRYNIRIIARDLAGNITKRNYSILVSPFSDINSLSSNFRGAVVGLVEKGIIRTRSNGIFSGDSYGKFHPLRKSSRGDLAIALAKCFGYEKERLDPKLRFKDVLTSSFIFRFANLAVKKGYLNKYGNGTFKPGAQASDALILSALVKSKGLDREARNITTQDPTNSPYSGYLVIAHHLGLKYRNSKTWPAVAFSRGEMAWSIYKAGLIEEWKISRIKKTFSKERLANLRASALQGKFIRFAKKWIGYPYVWGGDSPGEGGFDCSGLMYYDYFATYGYRIKRTAASAAADDRYPKISFDSLQPADLIFFWDEDRSRISHTGMYIGKGFFIHSSGSRCGVSIDIMDKELGSYWRDQFAWGRRVIPVLRVRSLTALPKAISPNRDGFADKFSVSCTISKNALLTLLISDRRGRIVWTKSSFQKLGKRVISWNGSLLNGKIAPSGRYKYRLGLVDEEGNRKAFEGGLWLDLIRPKLTRMTFNPQKFSPTQGGQRRTTISYCLSEKSYVDIRVVNSAEKLVRILARGLLRPSGNNLTYWDGRDSSSKAVGAGTYRVIFNLRDIVLNRGSASGVVAIF